MEETVAGFAERGSWSDVVEHGERLTKALREVAAAADRDVETAIDEWDEWRPKHHERLDEEVNEKTAEQASVEEGPGEAAGRDPDEDLQTAGEKLSDSYDRLDQPSEAVGEWRESIDYLARAADSAGRKALRTVEGAVYRNVMTQMSPYYFDNELVSANVSRLGTDDYALEVDVTDDDLKVRVSNELADLEQSVDRWHVDTPKETEQVAAAEGVEPPEEETDGDSEPTRT